MALEKKIMVVLPQDEILELKEEVRELKELVSDMYSSSGKKHDEWLTAKEAAKFLGVTTRTLSIWRQKGILKVAKIGRKLHFKRSDLDALLNRNTLNR